MSDRKKICSDRETEINALVLSPPPATLPGPPTLEPPTPAPLPPKTFWAFSWTRVDEELRIVWDFCFPNQMALPE